MGEQRLKYGNHGNGRVFQKGAGGGRGILKSDQFTAHTDKIRCTEGKSGEQNLGVLLKLGEYALVKKAKRSRKASKKRIPSSEKGPMLNSKVFENMKDMPLATTREIIKSLALRTPVISFV